MEQKGAAVDDIINGDKAESEADAKEQQRTEQCSMAVAAASSGRRDARATLQSLYAMQQPDNERGQRKQNQVFLYQGADKVYSQ